MPFFEEDLNRRAAAIGVAMKPFAANPSAVDPLGQLLVAGEIVEARHRGLEAQLHRAGRSVALLADDDFGLAVDGSLLGLPFEMLLLRFGK
jgi:hypothetical protein